MCVLDALPMRESEPAKFLADRANRKVVVSAAVSIPAMIFVHTNSSFLSASAMRIILETGAGSRFFTCRP